MFLNVPWAKGWSSVDTLLAMALEAYEATRVGSFGFPKRLTEGDYEGWFDVKLVQDNAQFALDMWRRDNKDGAPPGLVPQIVFEGSEEE